MSDIQPQLITVNEIHQLTNIIEATEKVAEWFMTDQTADTYASVINGGEKALYDYCNECKLSGQHDIDIDAANFNIAYQVVRDWDLLSLWRITGYNVDKYMGVIRGDDGNVKPI